MSSQLHEMGISPTDEKGDTFTSPIDLSQGKHETFMENAVAAEAGEKAMSPSQALKLYPKAVFWSWAISLCLVMEGYDTTLLSNLLALPVFRKKFGHLSTKTKPPSYQLDPAWQSAIGYAPTIGNIVGILIASWAQDRFGYRRTIQVALVLTAAFIFVVFFAPNIQVLFVGELLLGLPWGAFSTSAVSYASEVTPVGLRGYLTTYVNCCWVFGQILGSGILVPLTTRTDQWAYRIPFAIQWVWPIPIFILVTLAPESPWFLVRRGKLEEAENSINRLTNKEKNPVPAAQTVAMLVRTNEHEMLMHEGVSYWDCFKGVDLRRTEIVCLAWASQVLTGSPFANHPNYFFTQAGFTAEQATDLNLGVRGLSFLGTATAWILISYNGRRRLMLVGMVVLSLWLLLIGIISFPADTHQSAKWATAALIMIWVLTWDLTVTPVAYAIVGESSSTRLRSKSVGLARIAYNVAAIPGGIINTYSINPDGWGWGGRASFFWFGSCVLILIWTYFRLPECRGRSYRELDILFENKVSARHFQRTKIDLAAEGEALERQEVERNEAA